MNSVDTTKTTANTVTREQLLALQRVVVSAGNHRLGCEAVKACYYLGKRPADGFRYVPLCARRCVAAINSARS